ncbi:hypothetical protein TruAng_010219 [Truncatella angustata]|nr:hypothetical protein TruAng_010219 [Truncatella angustata]
MPCGHVAGFRCLHHWMSGRRFYCPFCKFSFRHSKCGHIRMPHVLDIESILTVPKTIPEGGRFHDYCKDCRLQREDVNEIINVWELKLKFIQAREALEQNGGEQNHQVKSRVIFYAEVLGWKHPSILANHNLENGKAG